ncbi:MULTISPECIES: hypothetical protein [unclassified Blautia]|uniref:hypothetical protein n=1 Tax=unclassified Blautia TaxID=2648079 RepID=UPI003F8B236A
MKNRKNEIRTPRQGAMVGTIGRVGNKPVAVVKQGNKVDTLSVDEFASALYGKAVICTIKEAQTK